MNLPVDFAAKASTKSGGYPVQISASDLMKNFNAAVLDAVDTVDGNPQPFTTRQSSTGADSGQRKLMIHPAPPDDGKTYVFGFKGGAFCWLPTEEC